MLAFVVLSLLCLAATSHPLAAHASGYDTGMSLANPLAVMPDQLLAVDFPNRVVTREMAASQPMDSRDAPGSYPPSGMSNLVSIIGFLTPSYTEVANVRARFYNPQYRYSGTNANPIRIDGYWLLSTNGGVTNVLPVTFNGSASVTLAPNEWVDSDVFPGVVLKSNNAYYHLTSISFPTYPTAGVTNGVPGCMLRYGGGTAMGMIESTWRYNVPTNNPANPFGWLASFPFPGPQGMGAYGPEFVYGKHLNPRGCCAIIGSSSFSDGACGWPAPGQYYSQSCLTPMTMAFSNNFPYLMLGASGLTIRGYVTNDMDKESFALQSCDRVLFGLGMNDIIAWGAPEVIKSNMQVAWAPWLAQGKPVFVSTFQPDATTSVATGWTNFSQVPLYANAITNLNNWLRTNKQIHCIDYGALWESSPGSGIWGWSTNSGTNVAWTGDGLHVYGSPANQRTEVRERAFKFWSSQTSVIWSNYVPTTVAISPTNDGGGQEWWGSLADPGIGFSFVPTTNITVRKVGYYSFGASQPLVCFWQNGTPIATYDLSPDPAAFSMVYYDVEPLVLITGRNYTITLQNGPLSSSNEVTAAGWSGTMTAPEISAYVPVVLRHDGTLTNYSGALPDNPPSQNPIILGPDFTYLPGGKEVGPFLSITQSLNGTVMLFWPSEPLAYVLQQNSNPANSAGWSDYGGLVNDDGTTRSVALPASAGRLFFRLRR